jgi:HAD superfamily hydrolase (TIGR01484 family)
MRFAALASDYDGTLATDGRVRPETLAALGRCKESGRKLLLVTGRELDDLLTVFPGIGVFDRVVAENGALLWRPDTREERPLGERPPEEFARTLRAKGVENVSVGRVIVATWEPHETTVLETIREMGLSLQVIFNKGAVMVLPEGVNKATGLAAALRELRLSPHNTAGAGDAENDQGFLTLCEFGVAVSNSLDSLKERADWVTGADHGAGVEELVERLLADDLQSLQGTVGRHDILVGTSEGGTALTLEPFAGSMLVAGPSASGKSSVTTAVLERLAETAHQFCLLDPEGDCDALSHGVRLGTSSRPPSVDEVLTLLGEPDESAVVGLVALSLAEQPAFFDALLPRLVALRGATGRPHWIVVDEAHHLMPRHREPSQEILPRDTKGIIFVTVHPDHLSPAVLANVETVVAMGEPAPKVLATFAGVTGREAPHTPPWPARDGEALVWRPAAREAPFVLTLERPRAEHRRHVRKFAHGRLPEDRSFWFRGPDRKLKLRAENLTRFLDLGEGVDEETWLHHLSAGDFSTWLRRDIKDRELADEIAAIERSADGASADDLRGCVRAAVERRYTAPA